MPQTSWQQHELCDFICPVAAIVVIKVVKKNLVPDLQMQ